MNHLNEQKMILHELFLCAAASDTTLLIFALNSTDTNSSEFGAGVWSVNIVYVLFFTFKQLEQLLLTHLHIALDFYLLVYVENLQIEVAGLFPSMISY